MKRLAVVIMAFIFVACASPKPSAIPANSSTDKPAITSSPAPTVSSSTSAATSLKSSDTPATAKLAAEIQKIHPESDATAVANLVAEIQKLHNESVYFDFNDYAVKTEFRNIIEIQATNILNHKYEVVVLGGNTDERGSAAYNLALGEKRSTSVKNILETLGVPSSKIKVVSYGKSKPKLDCHEEKCWQENRRVDFVFKQK